MDRAIKETDRNAMKILMSPILILNTEKMVSYRNRNKWMGAAVFLVLLVCWMLSFSKSWNAYRLNKELNTRLEDNYAVGERSFQVGRKYVQLDSLVKEFMGDSLAFQNSFLQDVSLALEGVAVQLAYDATKKNDSEESRQVLYGDIVLEGGYKELVRATARLERNFFVNRLLYKDGKCTLRLAKIKE